MFVTHVSSSADKGKTPDMPVQGWLALVTSRPYRGQYQFVYINIPQFVVTGLGYISLLCIVFRNVLYHFYNDLPWTQIEYETGMAVLTMVAFGVVLWISYSTQGRLRNEVIIFKDTHDTYYFAVMEQSREICGIGSTEKEAICRFLLEARENGFSDSPWYYEYFRYPRRPEWLKSKK